MRGYRLILLAPTNRLNDAEQSFTTVLRGLTERGNMGVYWLDLDDTSLDSERLREQVSALTDVVDACFSMWPLPRVHPTAVGVQSWPYTHPFPARGSEQSLMNTVEGMLTRSMILLAALHPLLSKAAAPCVVFHFNAIGSLSTASSSTLMSLRVGSSALASFIKALSFDLSHATVVGVHVGVWFRGLRDTDRFSHSLSASEASERFLQAFDSLDRVQHSGRTLRVPPVAVIPP